MTPPPVPPSSSSDLPPPPTPPPHATAGPVRPWAVKGTVSRRAYVGWGVGLMALKYGLDAALVYGTTGGLLSPLRYLSPLMSWRTEVLASAPDWAVWLMAVWPLPFAWVGAAMSARRARDAGLPALVGLGFFVPFANLLVMAMLAALPPRAPSPMASPSLDRATRSALLAVGLGAGISVAMVSISTLLAGAYGAALFIGCPALMGAVSGYAFNRQADRGLLATVGVSQLTTVAGLSMVLLFALDGIICISMAAPLFAVLGVVGGLLGRALAEAGAPSARAGLGAPMLAWPLLLFAEPAPGPGLVHQVATTVEVDAPPEAVWQVVIAFPEIPKDQLPAWYFQLGVAWPQRARIEGTGVGAVRHCEFSTGAFIEPVTVWEPGRRLAFDVVENPPTMDELSPWGAVAAPHLAQHILSSQRGEFRLEPLPGGRTRLTGTTWYTFDMAPTWYWTLWSDAILHAVHRRVLEHVARVAQGQTGA